VNSEEPEKPSSGTCHLQVDGQEVKALSGQSLAAALIQHGIWTFRRNPVSAQLRGPYCGMGVCFDCEVTVDGRVDVRACLIDVSHGMVVSTSAGKTRA
jgi:predicted molibdopterin-dependent oxidoreductase YjgC